MSGGPLICLAAVRRFTELRDGRVASVNEPEVLTTGRRQYLIVAGLLGDLAHEVFTALGVPTDILDAIGVRWASPKR